MRKPVSGNYRITSPFGATTGRIKPHTGTDWVSDDPYVYAQEAGRATRRFDTISGWGVDIEVGDHVWENIHMFEAGRVGNGAEVKEGQRIGKWGETKVANVTGAHLHEGLEVNGKQVDPEAYRNMVISNQGGAMSTVGEYEFNSLFRAYFGPLTETNQPTAGDRKRWIGAETNTVLRAMEVDPRHDAYERYVADMKKAIESSGIKFVPYNGEQLYVKGN